MQNTKLEKRQILFQKKPFGMNLPMKETLISVEKIFSHILGDASVKVHLKKLRQCAAKANEMATRACERNRKEVVHAHWLTWNVYLPTCM